MDGSFTEGKAEDPPVLLTARTEAGRVNILGVVISREELPVPTLIVDDGTGQVTVRSFERPLQFSIGSVAQVIGRPRSYQGQFYVAAEAAVAVHPGWAEYRKRELGAVREQRPQPVVVQQFTEENNAEKLLRLIKQLDYGEGADIDAVVSASKIPNAEAVIDQMLMHGDIFELRPGKVKVL